MTSLEEATRPEAGIRNERVCLEASVERETRRAVFPRMPNTSPSAHRFDPITLSSKATLYSYTTIHPNPKTGEPPFTLIYADFPEGARVFGRLQLAAGETPTIGSALTVLADGPDVNTSYFFSVCKEEE